jgi:hypothetical protein
METKKTAVDVFWLKLLAIDKDIAHQMLTEYLQCKMIESVQITNAIIFGRDELSNSVCGSTYYVKTYGDGSKDINSKQTPKIIYDINNS